MNDLIFPFTHWVGFMESFPKMLKNLNNAIDSRDYKQIIQLSTEAIDYIYQQQKPILLAFLETRAHAYSMSGQFDLGFADGKTMIEYVPTSPTGYIYKANILSMYGQHNNAIEIYDEGFKLVQSYQHKEIEALKVGKHLADKQFQKRVDPVHILPTEITNKIFSLLPQKGLVNSMQVSSLWRGHILQCGDAWCDLLVEGGPDDVTLARVTPSIGNYVKHMTINTTSEKIRFAFIKKIKEAQFNKIQSLYLTVLGTAYMRSYIAPTTTALWQIRNTLTSFHFDIDSNENVISIAEILSSCSNLSDLFYSTACPLSTQSTDFTLLEENNFYNLINLKIKSSSITESDIERILKRCPKIRRLLMNGCDDISILNRVDQLTSPNLEILGFNHPDNTTFPIPELNKETTTTAAIKKDAGLRVLYTNNDGTVFPASAILPLIYKSRTTLEDLVVNMSDVSPEELQQFKTQYPNFRLPNLTSLVTWPFRGIQDIIMPFIRYSTKLETLYTINVYDMDELINALMDMVTPLTDLTISFPHRITAEFVRLFENYARLSKEAQPSLEYIKLRHFEEITDQTLAIFGNIKTLRKINFEELNNVSADGVLNLIKQLEQRLTYVRLAEMEIVDDGMINYLSDIEGLTFMKLNGLKNVTDQGIRAVVDKKSNLMSFELEVTNCPLVTEECISYAKQNLKKFSSTYELYN
ncbi:hypothetical protein BDC45DRAFT_261528 [Circinella umbellata]|nr:hypothetical protein BDC45DRAFT_261528 [Circinella umbellata]